MNEKIGRYTEDEILEHLTEGEGRGFLGRSMYDAIFDKIHALKTENEQLQQENARLKETFEKITNYIKEHDYYYIYLDCKFLETQIYNDLLQMLNKIKEN